MGTSIRPACVGHLRVKIQIGKWDSDDRED